MKLENGNWKLARQANLDFPISSFEFLIFQFPFSP